MLEIGLIKFILYLFRPNIQIDSGSQFVRMNRQRRSTPRVDDCNIFRLQNNFRMNEKLNYKIEVE